MNKGKIFIFVLLTSILILTIAGVNSNGNFPSQPKAEAGILDLTQWKLEEKVVRLDGQWEFYYNQLLEPQELKESSTQEIAYIDIPGSWNPYAINDKNESGEGYATYKLIFKTDKNSRLGIKIPRIFTSYNLRVNGELIATAGIVGESRKTMTPQYLPQVALFDAQQGENEIIIQVSNFYHRSGGILESLVLGAEKQIMEVRYRSIAYEALLFGSLMIIGAYHLALFFFRKKNKSSLYFGLFCLSVGIRTVLVGEIFFIYLFPNFSWGIAHKIQTLTFYLGVPLILAFFNSVFPSAFNSKIIRIVWKVGIAFGGLVILTPAKIFTVFNPAYQIFTLIVIVYIVAVFIKLFFQKEKDIELILVGSLALIITSINDILFLSIWMNDSAPSLIRGVIRSGNLSSVGQLVFVFTNSLLLAQKFSNALEQEEVMTAKLKEVNSNLDELVMKRTKALEESREKVEYQKLELEKTNKALLQLSLKDSLTGLWNRRHYDNMVQVEWNRGLRQKIPIALMMLDIDYFKAYNDYYGHEAGDQCLVKVAQSIECFFKRSSDIVIRYGGEEFVVVMPQLLEDEAVKMACLLLQTIEELNIPHKGSMVSPWVTVSVGVTSVIPDMNYSTKELFLTVDEALYIAKNNGRNQVKFLEARGR